MIVIFSFGTPWRKNKKGNAQKICVYVRIIRYLQYILNPWQSQWWYILYSQIYWPIRHKTWLFMLFWDTLNKKLERICRRICVCTRKIPISWVKLLIKPQWNISLCHKIFGLSCWPGLKWYWLSDSPLHRWLKKLLSQFGFGFGFIFLVH